MTMFGVGGKVCDASLTQVIPGSFQNSGEFHLGNPHVSFLQLYQFLL